MTNESRTLLGALCGISLCSCSEPPETLFPGPLDPITELDCIDDRVPPPVPLGAIDGWSMGAGWESRVVCEHRHSHGYVDVSIPGTLCLGLNRGVGAMAAHPPVADGPGTYTVKLAAQVKNDQLIEVALSRGTDGESPDWARGVSAALQCSRPCESATDDRPRRCRPVVRFHDTPELALDTVPPHGRHEALPGHSARDYELECALKNEHAFPLPTAGTVTAEILVEPRSLGWKIDGALVSGFGPSYRLDHTRWSCARMDGTPAEDAAQRLFVVGLPFGEPAGSPDQPGYELAFEHWSPDGSRCAAAPLAGDVSDGAWMCVRDAGYASCDKQECPEACGDRTCDAWETSSTCYGDCGPQVAELAIASIDCGRSIDAGGPASCDVVLANQGTVDVGEFDNQLWLSRDETFSSEDALLGSCSSTPIAAGSTSAVTCSGTVPPATEAGTWYLGIIADSSNAVVELDESNNLDHASITVVSDYVPPADLIISSVFCESLSDTLDLECQVTVDNIGEQDAAPFLVDLRLSSDTVITDADLLLNTCRVSDGVDAGRSRTISCTFTIPDELEVGSWYVGAVADSADVVPESDESNNTEHDWHLIITQNGPPDLVVSSVDCPDSVASPGTIGCSVHISNQGESTASWVKNEVYLSRDASIDIFDTRIGSCEVSSLRPGETKTVTCSGAIPAGQFGSAYVGVIANRPPMVSELDDSNNTGHDSVSFRLSQADLVVSSVTCPPSASSPGTISCVVRIGNQGGSAASSFDNEMYLSVDADIGVFDTRIGTCNVPSLPAGGSQTVPCSGTIPAGQLSPRYVGVIADSSSRVSEIDESNNTGSASVSIQQAQADLVVSSVSCPPIASSPGSISCSVSISNQGGIAAFSFTNEMYLSLDADISVFDTRIGSCNVPSLPAGGSQTVICSGTIPAGHSGSRYVGIIADTPSRVMESNESNNTGRASINLTGSGPFP